MLVDLNSSPIPLHSITPSLLLSCNMMEDYTNIAPCVQGNQFYRKKFVLDYNHQSTHVDTTSVLLQRLGAQVVTNIDEDVYMLIVDDGREQNTNYNQNNVISRTTLSNRQYRASYYAATKSKRSGAATLSQSSSTPIEASILPQSLPESLTLSSPVPESRISQAHRLKVKVMERSKFYRLLISIPHPSTPRIIVQDINRRYKESIKVFNQLSFRSTQNSYGVTRPMDTYPIINWNYKGNRSPFSTEYKMSLQNVRTIAVPRVLPPVPPFNSAAQSTAVDSASFKSQSNHLDRNDCTVVSDSDTDSDTDSFGGSNIDATISANKSLATAACGVDATSTSKGTDRLSNKNSMEYATQSAQSVKADVTKKLAKDTKCEVCDITFSGSEETVSYK